MSLFDKIEKDLFDKAVKSDCGDFSYSFDTGKYQVNLEMEVSSKKLVFLQNKKNHLCYENKRLEILDENDNDVSDKFPLFAERVKQLAPDYDDVLGYIKDSSMTPEELYFGSMQNYLHYRYGN